jgi:hypothetical protein
LGFCGFVGQTDLRSSAHTALTLTNVSSLLATLMLLLDKNDLDNLWHSDIRRTDCFESRGKRERERERERDIKSQERRKELM